MRTIENKRADLTFIKILIALIVVLLVAWLLLPLFDKILGASKETVAKGICGSMMAIRSKMTAWVVGDVVKSSALFSLSPSCGNAYTEPCKQTADCLAKTRRQISYCWNITRNDPGSQMTCLYNLDINMSDTPTATICGPSICPGTTVCKPGEADVNTENIEFKDNFCANDKDSMSMEYDGAKVIVKCQGKCK